MGGYAHAVGVFCVDFCLAQLRDSRAWCSIRRMIACDLSKGQSHDTSPQLNLTTRYISLGCLCFPAVSAPYAQEKVSKLATELDGKLEAMIKLAVEEGDLKAMKKEVVDLRKKIEMKDEASLDLKVNKHGRVVDGGHSACLTTLDEGLLAANTRMFGRPSHATEHPPAVSSRNACCTFPANIVVAFVV